MTEQQAIAAMASNFDGATWHAHRTGSALHDPRALPHGHPAMWQSSVTAVSLARAMRVGGPTMVGYMVTG